MINDDSTVENNPQEHDHITLGQGHTLHFVIVDPQWSPCIIDVGLNSIVRAIPVSLTVTRAKESFGCIMLKQKI